jgi:hypothetical protein
MATGSRLKDATNRPTERAHKACPSLTTEHKEHLKYKMFLLRVLYEKQREYILTQKGLNCDDKNNIIYVRFEVSMVV